MKGRKLNPSQEAVADCRDKLCVVAGAGSGKTHTLVEALVRRLEEAHELPDQALDVTDILALTFTEKAAAELRQRLAETFRRRQLETAEASMAEFWRGQAQRLDRADIGTIHGYALTLVRENAVGLGLGADPAIDDDPRLARQDLEQIITDWLETEDPDLLALLRIFPLRVLTEMLADCSARLSSWGLTELQADLEVREADLKPLLGEFKELAHGTLAALESGELKVNPKKAYYPVILKALRRLTHLLNRPVQEILEDLDLTLARAGSLFKESGNWYAKAAQSAKKKLIELWEELVGRRGEEEARPVKAHYLALMRRLPLARWERKRLRNAIDFDDILILARRLLAGRPDLRQREINRRKLILIDEFQDTNRLQADILAYLLLPADDEQIYQEDQPRWPKIEWAEAAPRFSAYGDLKQSIYRFRGAEVEVMAGLSRALASGAGRVLALDYNYRSQKPLIDFFNRLFARHLAEGFGSLDRQTPVRPPLYEGPHVVQLRPAGDRPTGGAAGAETQARVLVQYLKKLCGPETSVRISDPISGESRPPRAGDVAVLFRRFTWAGLFKEKLLAAGWPCRVAMADNPFDYAEVKGLVAAFDYLNGLDADLSLAAFLRSPLGPVSDRALLSLAWPGPRPRSLASWFQAELTWPPDILPEDSQILTELRLLLKELAPLVGRVPAVQILERLVEERRLIPLAGLEADGEDRIRAITRFLALSRTLGRRREQEPKGPAEELREIRLSWSLRRGGDGIRPVEEAVTLMTVHAAKGLEFPVVIIAEADSQPKNTSSPVLIGPDGRLALRFKNSAGLTVKPADYRQLEEEHKFQDIRENGRLLYVAATRAQDHLVFLGRPNPRKETARSKMAGDEEAGTSPATVWLEALLDCPEASALTSIVEMEPEQPEDGGPPQSPRSLFDFLPDQDDEPPAEADLLEPMRLNSQTLAVTSLSRLLADPQAFGRETRLGLDRDFHWKKGEPFFSRVRPDSLFKTDQTPLDGSSPAGLTPQEAGTLFHAVMEELNPLSPGFRNLIDRAAGKLGLIPKAREIEFLELKLGDFLEGPLGAAWRAGRKAGKPDFREWPFWLKLPQSPSGFTLTFNGIIDLFFIGPDGTGHIVDYKLAPFHPGPELAAYENQLRLYAEAVVAAGFEGGLEACLYFGGPEKSFIHRVELEFPRPISPIWPDIEKNLQLIQNTRPLRPNYPEPLNIVYF